MFVGVPVYRGAGTVCEALLSIRDQTLLDYRVLISVDGGDLESAEACERFLEDPRFEMIVHNERLGWRGNFNWLVRQADLPFFMFWQQDDLAAGNYLERLHREMFDHPDTAAAYADIHWLGRRSTARRPLRSRARLRSA